MTGIISQESNISTAQPAQIQDTVNPPKYSFEVVDQYTPAYLDKIKKPELTMLIHMLEELGHKNMAGAKEAYGYPSEGSQEWNEETLATYKNITLKNRMTNQGYTFFKLFNEKGELVALASGNRGYGDDKKGFHLLNVTVSREHRGQKHTNELIKQISHYATERGWNKVSVSLSEFAQKLGRVEMYQHIAKKLGIKFPTELEKTEGVTGIKGQTQYVTITPQKFIELETKPDIIESYCRLKLGDGAKAITSGCFTSEKYPGNDQLNFQATDFPTLAGSGKVSMLANNQAFFFVRNNSGKPELNIDNLEKLLRNIKKNNTDFTLRLDNDLFANPDNFIEKYYKLRTEPDDQAKKDYLKAEATIIADFIKGPGLKDLVVKIISSSTENSAPTPSATAIIADKFLKNNFKIEGVVTEKPLTHAVWNIEGENSNIKLSAIQTYGDRIDATKRPFHLGTQPELGHIKEQNNVEDIRLAPTSEILDKLTQMQALEKVNILGASKAVGLSQKL